MEFYVKTYDELTKDELYDILKLRMEIFVVEQKCAYQDIDEFDKISVHVFLKEDNSMIAYLRVLPQNTVFENASLGRVISKIKRQGIGSSIVKEGIKAAKTYFKADTITIEAQTYVCELYEKLGFVKISEPFLEDGIPHIKMELKL